MEAEKRQESPHGAGCDGDAATGVFLKKDSVDCTAFFGFFELGPSAAAAAADAASLELALVRGDLEALPLCAAVEAAVAAAGDGVDLDALPPLVGVLAVAG
jgi:hypothetical protein